MITDISDRLTRLIAERNFAGLEADEECRRALGFILLDRDKKNQAIGHCETVAQFALFPVEHQTRVALMIIKWPGADWGTPMLWSERFY